MNNKIFSKKIPTVFAGILLLVGIGITSYFVRSGFSIFGLAASDTAPQNVRITNITSSSFTVTYTTTKAAVGSLKYGLTTPETLVLDDRDASAQTPTAYSVHSLTIKNLKPQTTYLFSILSNNTAYLDQGKPFSVRTTQLKETTSETLTFSGSVQDATGTPREGLVYLSLDGSQIFSTLLKKDGTYVFTLGDIFTASLTELLQISDATKMTILVTTSAEQSTAMTLFGNGTTIPLISLPNNYDFTINPEGDLIASDSASLPNFPVQTAEVTEDQDPEIITPDVDEVFNDQQPRFRGVGLPNQEVEITIRSDTPDTVKVQTDASGNWSYRPETPLKPGNHTISVKTQNAKGFMSFLERAFVVNAAGSQFPDPSVSPTQPTPTLTPTITPTGTPEPTPTLTPTETPTPTNTPTPTSNTTPRPTIADTGDTSTLLFTTGAIVAIIVGFVAFVFTSGAL